MSRDEAGQRTGAVPALLGGGGVAPPSPLQYRYRDQIVDIGSDARWLREHLADARELRGEGNEAETELCTSRSDTLDLLWARFRSRAVGDAADYHGLLGCYNLHRADFEGAVYQFWGNGWGAPHRAFLYTAQLARTFVEYAALDDVNPDAAALFPQCAGFVDFLRDTLDRTATTRSDDYVSGDWSSAGSGPCTLRIEYRNRDTRYPQVSAPACSEGSNLGCSAGFNQEGSEWTCWNVPEWDTAQVEFRDLDASGNPIYCLNGNPYDSGCDRPQTSCPHSAFGGEWRVLFTPTELYFRGVTIDYEMWLARLAWDRAVFVAEEGDLDRALELAQVASRIARYALRVLASHAQVLIHELGHVYLGAHHCEGGKNCCFVVASLAWLCRVRADLGLPDRLYEPRLATEGGDYDHPPSVRYRECERCGSGDRMPFYCDTVEEGVPGEVAVVLGASCYDDAARKLNGC